MGLRRDELVGKALEYLLDHGISGLSLRPIAEQIGSSSRLLIYHFGTKEGLIAAVMEELHARVQKSFVEGLREGTVDGAPRGAMQGLWHWLLQPRNLRQARLLFEVQALALRSPDEYGRYVQKASSSWLGLIEGALPASPDAHLIATLCTAVMDGLLLETLATGDAKRTTGALNLFVALLGARTEPLNASVANPERMARNGGPTHAMGDVR